jgi:phage tail-like protein
VAQFSVNTQRFDPYKNFRFRIKWKGRYVAGMTKVGPLKRITDIIFHREAGDMATQRQNPGLTKYDPILLERGLTLDREFHDMAGLVFNYNGRPGAGMSLANSRFDWYLEFQNEAGQKVLGYFVYRSWVVEYVALPELDANSAHIAIESIKLAHEGFERDPNVTEPQEPTLSNVAT